MVENNLFSQDDTIFSASAKVGYASLLVGVCLAFGMVLMTPLVMVGWAIDGVVTCYLWNWFVQPIFPGCPTLTILQCIGAVATVRYLATHNTPTSKKKDKDEKEVLETEEWKEVSVKVISRWLLYPGIVLIVAWALHHFFPVG